MLLINCLFYCGNMSLYITEYYVIYNNIFFSNKRVSLKAFDVFVKITLHHLQPRYII